MVPADVVNARAGVRLLEQTAASETEIQEALSRHEDFLRRTGRVGEQLEEAMERFEGDLRRWGPT